MGEAREQLAREARDRALMDPDYLPDPEPVLRTVPCRHCGKKVKSTLSAPACADCTDHRPLDRRVRTSQ